MGDWKKALIYIDACFFNAETLDFIKGKISHSEDSIRKNKYIAKLALQYSQILSNLEKFKKLNEKNKWLFVFHKNYGKF